MSDLIAARLRELLGELQVERDPDGIPRAVPTSAEGVALICGAASEAGWKIRIEGQGTWLPMDAPADLTVSTRALDQVISVSPADLVATVQAGATLEAVRRRLADDGMWLALDPPGRPERSIGSVLATATSGPLRQAYGPVRDHVLGCTAVTGDGRVVRAGGRVVKNVAGFDLTKLQIGGFGGFGIITEAHLRLRALPRADVTLTARAPRDTLTSAARDLVAVGAAPVAMELLSPALAAESDWLLAVRLAGGDAAVREEVRRLPAETDLQWQPLPSERSAAFWSLASRALLGGPVTIRLGVLVEGIDDAVDLLIHELGESILSAGAGSGMIRWTGDVAPDRLRNLRRTLATREIPLTVERAPWNIRHAVGHFGAYREGVGVVVERLRQTFDPELSLNVALEGGERG